MIAEWPLVASDTNLGMTLTIDNAAAQLRVTLPMIALLFS